MQYVISCEGVSIEHEAYASKADSGKTDEKVGSWIGVICKFNAVIVSNTKITTHTVAL